MNKISRFLLFGALTLVLLTACTGQEGSPTAVGTTVPADVTAIFPPVVSQTAEIATNAAGTVDTTATIDTATPGVPLTGSDVILLECQYCIQGIAHALLVLPDTASYETVADTATLSTPGPDMGCNTVDTYQGRQVVICRAQENTSLNLNICTDGNNCQQLLVELQSCPLSQNGTLEANGTNTPEPGLPKNTPVGGTTDTPVVVTATSTP